MLSVLSGEIGLGYLELVNYLLVNLLELEEGLVGPSVGEKAVFLGSI
jgi:hypothetical protein